MTYPLLYNKSNEWTQDHVSISRRFGVTAASISDLQSQILFASACTADTQFDTYVADWQGAHGLLSPSDLSVSVK